MSTLTIINLGDITRLLRVVKGLQGEVYIVGGVVTEGKSVRDLDIVITNTADIPIIKKALGKYGDVAHFLLQKGRPPAAIYVKVVGTEGVKSPDPFKGKAKIPKNEYAN